VGRSREKVISRDESFHKTSGFMARGESGAIGVNENTSSERRIGHPRELLYAVDQDIVDITHPSALSSIIFDPISISAIRICPDVDFIENSLSAQYSLSEILRERVFLF
jgi:hypothetical protein